MNGGKENILIVDDNAIITQALSGLLKGAGYEPVIFNAGQPALDYALSNRPALALLDIHLPDLSGLVLSSLLRQHLGPEMPIVLFSGDTSMETLNSLAHVGATYFMSKPIHAKELLEHVEKWMGENKTKDMA